MNRRGFFGVIAGALAARFAPKPVVQMLGIEDAAARLGYRAGLAIDWTTRNFLEAGTSYREPDPYALILKEVSQDKVVRLEQYSDWVQVDLTSWPKGDWRDYDA